MAQNQGFVISRGHGNWRVDDYTDGNFVARLTDAFSHIARTVIPGNADYDITVEKPLALALTSSSDFRDLYLFLLNRAAWISPERYGALLLATISGCSVALLAAGIAAYCEPGALVGAVYFGAGALAAATPALLTGLRNRFRKA